MNLLFWKQKQIPNIFPSSQLFDENNFYEAFIKDLHKAKEEVIIESPFITSSRIKLLLPVFKNLVKRGISVYIITRDPQEHDENLQIQAKREIEYLDQLGITIVLCSGYHHRKLAILDRSILWEGSLNILSYYFSREVMRRIHSEQEARVMFSFLKLDSVI